jgi:lysylphosphatidylglycerol synthetase-like protein (DUF2156 family)
MTTRPRTVTLNYIFILLNALVWLVLGVIIAASLHPALPDQSLLKGIMAFMSFAGAAILLLAFILLLKRKRTGFFLALGFLLVTALLTFFDQVGWVDLLTLVIITVPIILLIKDRDWYLSKGLPFTKE